MLIRRIRTRCIKPVVCIGTSATMVSAGSVAEQRAEVAKVATKLFGKPFVSEQIINETLACSLDYTGFLSSSAALAQAIDAGIEEERASLGYEIRTYFSVDGGQIDRVRKGVAMSTENALLNLRYIPTARLIHVNAQWRSQKTEGFPIALISGDWRSSMPDSSAGVNTNLKEEFRLVKLWTSAPFGLVESVRDSAHAGLFARLQEGNFCAYAPRRQPALGQSNDELRVLLWTMA